MLFVNGALLLPHVVTCFWLRVRQLSNAAVDGSTKRVADLVRLYGVAAAVAVVLHVYVYIYIRYLSLFSGRLHLSFLCFSLIDFGAAILATTHNETCYQ